MNELITLVTVYEVADEDGFVVETKTKRTDQYCEVRSASYLDAYESMKVGTNASVEFVMRKEDFDECRVLNGKKHEYPTIVEWEGAEYHLVRWRYLPNGKASVICG